LPDVQVLSSSTPGQSGSLSGVTVSTSVTAQLQIGTRARDPADLWRERFYSLAAMTQYFVSELAATSEGDDFLLLRAPFLIHWPSDTDIALPTAPLAAQLLPYFTSLADPNVEPDI